MDKPDGQIQLGEIGDPGPIRRWLFYAGILAFVFILCATFNVWLRIQYIQDGYSLARLQAEHEQLLAARRKLQLEWTQLRNPGYLEKLGKEKFGLAAPRPHQKVLIR
jgi:cell division protein FtsL